LGSRYKGFLSQVAWLNKSLTKMWPHINKAGAKLLTETITPILEMYKPAVLEKMKIQKLTLGNVAPEITGKSFPRLLELKQEADGNP
jgi:Ca2+-dependent lipid-binding protein